MSRHEENFFRKLKAGLEKPPSSEFDGAFWGRFAKEFGDEKADFLPAWLSVRAVWATGMTAAAAFVCLLLFNPQLRKTILREDQATQIAEVPQSMEILEHAEMLTILDDMSTAEADLDFLLGEAGEEKGG